MVPGSAHAGGDSCPYGYKNCDTKKKDCETYILGDVKNCGDCGKECKWKPHTTVKCENKQCVYKYECKADIHNDVNNCGKCDNKCEEKSDSTVKCENKRCVYKKKCHADTKKDVNNCGKCGNKCTVQWKGGEVKCEDGQCKQHCKYGYEYDWNKKCCEKKKQH